MTFQLELIIDKPIDQVVRIFADRAQIPKWQPGFISEEKMESQPYPKYKLRFQIGRRKLPIMETITRSALPGDYEHIFELKGLKNTIRESFESVAPTQTKWTSRIEFRYKWVMNLVAPFMRENLREQSRIIQRNFKGYCESR